MISHCVSREKKWVNRYAEDKVGGRVVRSGKRREKAENHLPNTENERGTPKEICTYSYKRGKGGVCVGVGIPVFRPFGLDTVSNKEAKEKSLQESVLKLF
jgi:hypothetical protein